MQSQRKVDEFSQSFLLDAAKFLGFATCTDGICAGVTQMAIQAGILREFRTFDARNNQLFDIWSRLTEINRLTNNNPGSHPRYESAYKLAISQLHRIDYLAYFNGIVLNQSPHRQPGFINFITQFMPMEIAKISASIDLMALGGLVQIEHYLAFYNELDLQIFFSSFAMHKCDHVLAFGISCKTHRIAVFYDGKDKSWRFFDPNSLRFININLLELVTKIFSIYTKDDEKELAFSIRLYTAKKYAPEVSAITAALRNYKTFHDLNVVPHFTQQTADKNDLLHLAVKYNHIEKIRELNLLVFFDPNLINESGLTPLHYALSYKHTEAALTLLENPRVQVDMVDTDGNTALHIATSNDLACVVEQLLKRQANPNLANPVGSTSTMLAALSTPEIQSFYVQHHANSTKGSHKRLAPQEPIPLASSGATPPPLKSSRQSK